MGKLNFTSGLAGGLAGGVVLWGCLYLAADKYLGDGKLKEALVKRIEGETRIKDRIALPIAEGFVPPNDLELKITDLDGDGKSEMILRIYNQEYLVKKGEKEGTTQFIPYSVKRKEVQIIERTPYVIPQ